MPPSSVCYHRYFPSLEGLFDYPQLGCSGFVIADPTATTVIEPRTPAFLEYRQAVGACVAGGTGVRAAIFGRAELADG